MALATGSLTTTAVTAGGTVAIYTVSTSTYSRDLVIMNSSTAASNSTAFTMFVATGSSSVATTSGFPIPPGDQLVLQGNVGASLGSSNNIIWATAASAVTAVVGGGSVVSVI